MTIATGLGLRRRFRSLRANLAARLDRPRWLRAPLDRPAARLCILATYSADGSVDPHAIDWARAWRGHGFQVVLVVATDAPRDVVVDEDAPIDAVLVRRNSGYDFGSWRAALRRLPGLADVRLLALANDSVYGPLSGFAAMLERVDASTADFIGMTDSHQRGHHVQSYLAFYRPAAIRSTAFRAFWTPLRIGGREEIIAHSELRLLDAMREGGLRCEVLYPADPASDCNPTLVLWRELLERGYPFVKVQLLRDNPFDVDLHDWPSVLRSRGFDPERVVRHLGARYAASAAARALDAGR